MHNFYLNVIFSGILQGVLKLKHRKMADDTRPIDPTCACMVCLKESFYLISYLKKSACAVVYFFCHRFARTIPGLTFTAL